MSANGRGERTSSPVAANGARRPSSATESDEATETAHRPPNAAEDIPEAESAPTWEDAAFRYFTEMHAYRDALWECLPLLNAAADQGAGGDFDGMYSHVCDVLGIPDDLMARDPDVIGGVVAARKAIRREQERDSKAK